jgi:hypothetical protein
MARVTDAEVKTIFDTSIDTTPFITTANLIVTENLGEASLSDDRLKQIELYLSAHLACLRDPRVSQEKIGDASNTHEGKTGMGLDRTSYGQMVRMLDSTGLLADSELKTASIQTIRADLTRTRVDRRDGTIV